MKREAVSFLGLALVCLLLHSANVFAVESDPDLNFFETTFGDFSEELVRAKEEGKKGIMLFFELDDCPFCARMRATVLNQSEVQEYFRQHFLLFSVDIEGQTDIVDFQGKTMKAKYYSEKVQRIRGTPTIAFFDLSGEQMARYIGATANVEEFMWLGKYVVEDHYKEMPFVKYKLQMKRP